MWGNSRGPGGARYSERGPEDDSPAPRRFDEDLPPLPEEDRKEQDRQWREGQRKMWQDHDERKKEALNRALEQMGLKPRG